MLIANVWKRGARPKDAFFSFYFLFNPASFHPEDFILDAFISYIYHLFVYISWSAGFFKLQFEHDGLPLHKSESTTMLCDPSEIESSSLRSRLPNASSLNASKSLSDEQEHEFSSMVCDDQQVEQLPFYFYKSTNNRIFLFPYNATIFFFLGSLIMIISSK